MSDIVERLGEINGYDDDLHEEAAETILALRAEVEAAKADAALARQGYATAYAEFDKKCRTINRLVCEKSAMKKALCEIGQGGLSAVAAKNIARAALAQQWTGEGV